MIPWLSLTNYAFPATSEALDDPNGLLAAGGDLSWQRILSAYCEGVFPWFNEEDPILWWSPNPRTVVFPDELHISRSLQKKLKKNIFEVTFDHCFEDVMRACAAPRSYADDTWISEDIIQSYCELHARGFAHSVEVWHKEKLVGGLYGLALGKVFFGESMFSCMTDASKTGFVYLVQQLQQWNFQVIDCQVASDHLFSLGAREINREKFKSLIKQHSNCQEINSLILQSSSLKNERDTDNWATIELTPWAHD